jgi:ectonucleotide pyrophosphatase/phosphodiesterase family protein 5
MSPTSLALAVLTAYAAAVTRHPLVVVVSFDGFRPDYVQANATPTLSRFLNASAAPPYMRPAFPTKTFVNHHTIATGLHPEQHGVLDNHMFDRNNKTMHYTYEQFHYDESVVPIWVRRVLRTFGFAIR